MTERGKLIVVSGPSGAGKSTVISNVTNGMEDVHFSVSMTTRPRSPNERDGVDYFFVSPERFEEMVNSGGFLEYDRHMDNSYGTPRAAVEEMLSRGNTVILDIDVKGAAQVKKTMPEAVTIFITPPDLAELERRLRLRKRDSEEQLKLRLKRAEYELSRSDEYDHIIVNDDLKLACDHFKRILSGLRRK